MPRDGCTVRMGSMVTPRGSITPFPQPNASEKDNNSLVDTHSLQASESGDGLLPVIIVFERIVGHKTVHVVLWHQWHLKRWFGGAHILTRSLKEGWTFRTSI